MPLETFKAYIRLSSSDYTTIQLSANINKVLQDYLYVKEVASQ